MIIEWKRSSWNTANSYKPFRAGGSGPCILSSLMNNNNPNNDLGQFFDGQEKIITALSEIGKSPKIKVHHVNFENERIIISVEGADTSFDGIMSAVNFCRLTERMLIKAVDFDTGEITIEWFPEEQAKYLRIAACGLSGKEIEELKKGRKIHAIKAHRERTGMGLKDSKEAIEKGWADYQSKMGI